MYQLIYRWHLLIGLAIAPVLVVVAISGAIFAFAPHIQRVADEGVMHPPCTACEPLSYQQLFDEVKTRFPGQKLSAVAVEGSGHSVQFSYFDKHGMNLIFVDPYSAKVLAHRPSPGGSMAPVLELHRSLFGGLVGRLVVELSTGWLLITVWLGALLWWPNRARLFGGWLPRVRRTGRGFWRDIHTVVGFWFLPVCLLLVVTGSFFTLVAGKTLLGATATVGGAPLVFAAGPTVPLAVSQRPQPLDTFIDQHNSLSGSDQFFLLLPYSSTGNVQVSNDMGRYPWLYRKTWFNPQTGEVLQSVSWAELDFSSKVFGLLFPLHTGKIAGLPSQILVASGSLVIALLSLSGVWVWWRSRSPASPSLPAKPKQAVPRWWYLWLAPLLLFAPLAVVSMGVLAAASQGLYVLKKRRT